MIAVLLIYIINIITIIVTIIIVVFTWGVFLQELKRPSTKTALQRKLS